MKSTLLKCLLALAVVCTPMTSYAWGGRCCGFGWFRRPCARTYYPSCGYATGCNSGRCTIPSCSGGSCTVDAPSAVPTVSDCPSCDSSNGCAVCDIARGAVKTVAESIYLTKVNAVRARYGRAPLRIDATLERGCEQHAAWMANYGVLQHASGGYGSGEIIAQNNGVGIETALGQWQNSSAHAALLLNPYFSRCGIATKRDAYGRNWCVMRFQ